MVNLVRPGVSAKPCFQKAGLDSSYGIFVWSVSESTCKSVSVLEEGNNGRRPLTSRSSRACNWGYLGTVAAHLIKLLCNKGLWKLPSSKTCSISALWRTATVNPLESIPRDLLLGCLFRAHSSLTRHWCPRSAPATVGVFLPTSNTFA